MPDFAIVSVTEAQLRTASDRQAKYLSEYAAYIQKLPQTQAGKLHIFENEKHSTIRRRLVVAAKILGINLVIKRSGDDMYFWTEAEAEEQARPRNGRRRQRHKETAEPEQYFRETGELDQEETEESPELG